MAASPAGLRPKCSLTLSTAEGPALTLRPGDQTPFLVREALRGKEPGRGAGGRVSCSPLGPRAEWGRECPGARQCVPGLGSRGGWPQELPAPKDGLELMASCSGCERGLGLQTQVTLGGLFTPGAHGAEGWTQGNGRDGRPPAADRALVQAGLPQFRRGPSACAHRPVRSPREWP